jgi:dethiobiotin synthetase
MLNAGFMSYFIAGTDTGVGKTLISCALLHGFCAPGMRMVGFKPVAAGCNEQGRNEDAMQLHAASNVSVCYEQINPYCFSRAIAPHLAAACAGVLIDLQRIVTVYRELAVRSDGVIVEGVGGFCVPLNEQQDGADMALSLNLPVILVVGIRLGCLNHAQLSAYAIEGRGLELAGWVANCLDATMPMLNENIVALQQRIKAPLLGVVPHYQSVPDARVVAAGLNLSLLKH